MARETLLPNLGYDAVRTVRIYSYGKNFPFSRRSRMKCGIFIGSSCVCVCVSVTYVPSAAESGRNSGSYKKYDLARVILEDGETRSLPSKQGVHRREKQLN